MWSALATMTPSAPVSGMFRSASMAYERPMIRGTIPRWTFCTSPWKVNRVFVGSGGRIPKNTLNAPSSGRTRLRSASSHHRSCSSLSFSGWSAAMFFAWEKSSGR